MTSTQVVRRIPHLIVTASVTFALSTVGAEENAEYKWRPTNAPEASSRTDDVFFIDPRTGWAVNSNGQIIHTDDGGNGWTVQKLVPRPSYLRCVGFVDKDCGWVGSIQPSTDGDPNKRLLKTDDGGTTWEDVTNLPAGAPTAICGLSVVNKSVVYGSGTNDPVNPTAIVKTTDGGKTWSVIDMSEHAELLVDIFFSTPERGWVVGGRSDKPTRDRADVTPVVLFTEDGGKTWIDRVAGMRPQFPKGEWGWKIQFLDERHGFVSLESFDRGAILTTDDGGKKWVRKVINDKQPNGQPNANLEGIGFITPEHGWVGGWGDASFQGGYSSVTTDGGDSWRAANEIGRFINRFRFFFKPELLGYASGKTVYKYSREPIPAEVARAERPARFLAANEPLPSPGPVEVIYRVPEGAKSVALDFWDRFGFYLGRAVEQEDPRPGSHTARWDRKDRSGHLVPKGMVIFRLTVDGKAESGLAELK